MILKRIIDNVSSIKGVKMKRILVILPFFFTVGCASVATGIDTTRKVFATAVETATDAGTSMVSAVAKDVSGVVSTTAEVVSGVADTVGSEVKEQSDELKVEAPDFPTGKLKEEG